MLEESNDFLKTTFQLQNVFDFWAEGETTEMEKNNALGEKLRRKKKTVLVLNSILIDVLQLLAYLTEIVSQYCVHRKQNW